MKKKILILNYGTGNLNSISRTFKRFDCDINIDNTIKSIDNAEIVILPGVGTFSKAITTLKKKSIFDHLKKISRKGKNLFGICLGMQLLSYSSEELKKTQGLKLILGNTKKISEKHHIGWNNVYFDKSSIFSSLEKKEFYFQHQFHIQSNYGQEKGFFKLNKKNYLAYIKKNNILGVQFHPEKSQNAGLDFLKIYFESIYG